MQNKRAVVSEGGIRPGALGLGQSQATALSYFFQFWCYVTPILGAIVADAWLGRYNAIMLFSMVYIVGLIILFTTSLPGSLDNGAGLGGLVTAMIILGLGYDTLLDFSHEPSLTVKQYWRDQIQRLTTYCRAIYSHKATGQNPQERGASHCRSKCHN